MDIASKETTYIVCSPRYRDDAGGAIALHRLCHVLRKNGKNAFLWDLGRPSKALSFYFFRALMYKLKLSIKGPYSSPARFDCPEADQKDLVNAIVIYPEIVSGNPLGASKVVRWFMHKPGHHTGVIKYDRRDLCFFFQDAFRDDSLQLSSGGFLQALDLRNDIFYNRNLPDRSGSCYMIRKGVNKEIVHNTVDSTCLDGLSNEAIADIFNSSEIFISYDLYTMYSRYAAMCGCLSVVIPDDDLPKDQWRSDVRGRYGIAYGFDDVEWAKSTQKKLPLYLSELEHESIESIRNFVVKCESYF